MASSTRVPAQNAVVRPSIARVRDYWLGGTHHTASDRELADHFAVCAPHLPYLVRTERALLRRLVGYLIEHGVRQFLDLGSGVPAGGNVHEVAQELDSACRVVYVDFDPDLAREGGRMLADNANTTFLQADIREPARIMNAPELRNLLDLRKPVAVLLTETLLHIPDSDNPAAMVVAYTEPLCPGSYVAITHFSENEQQLKAYGIFERMMFGSRPEVHLRSPEEVAGFLGGLDLIEPGVVPVPLWHPAPEDEPDRNPEQVQMHVGVGRKR